MRRIFILLLILLSVLLLATACARDEEPVPEQTQTSQAPPEPSYTPEPAEPPIAFVLNGQTQFNETFAQAAQPQVEAAGFRALLFYSESAEAQVEDMYAAIGSGAACIVVSPFDMDNLYEVLDEADMQGIPVVNVNVPVAGIVKTLVSPDYAEMGAMAAQACGNARPDGASVLMIDDLSSPFVAQMKRDGFMARAEELGNVSLAAAVLADGTEGSVQQATEKAIAENESVNAVFSTEELFYPGALAAVRASGRDISIISVGGGEGVLGEVAGGGLYASVFSSPAELARIAGEDAVILARDSNAGVLSFEWLKLELITRDNAVQYAAKGGYADLLTPVALSPSPSEQAAPEQGTASAET